MKEPEYGVIRGLVADFHLTGELPQDAARFLTHHQCPKTAAHCAAVAAEAGRLARSFGTDVSLAEQAGWLHDISAVIPISERVAVSDAWGIDVLPEEIALPMILHQKLSVVLARELFGVDDPVVLSAIGCHTTLRANATLLDKVVFLADKIAWDQPGVPPYRDALLVALTHSLDAGLCVYLRHLWAARATLPVVEHAVATDGTPPGGSTLPRH